MEKIFFASTTGYQYFDDDMKMDQDFSPEIGVGLHGQLIVGLGVYDLSLQNDDVLHLDDSFRRLLFKVSSAAAISGNFY